MSAPQKGTSEQTGFHVQVPADHDVFHGIHVVEEFDVLKCPGNAHAGNLVRFLAPDVSIFEKDLALVGFVDTVDTVEQGGFAGTVGTDNGVDLAFFDLKGDVVECL